MLVGLFLAAWLLALLDGVGLLPLAGGLSLSLYRLYAAAAFLGWLAGNLYVQRSSRRLPRWLRRRVWMVYFIGPPGIIYLLWALAPAADQAAAPMVPIYAMGVFAVLFQVPVLLRPRRRSP